MLKVCHITSVHQRYDVRIFRKQCCSLADLGYDVTLIVNDRLANEICCGVRIVSTNDAPKNKIERIVRSKRHISALALEVDADIYCFHDPELFSVGLWLKRKKKKVIFDCHEFYEIQILSEKDYIPKPFRKIISKCYHAYESFVVKNIDVVQIPCTLNGKNIFENRAQATVIISNYPMLEEFYDCYEERKADSEKKICHVGSLSYVRGICHLVKASEKAKVTLILGGSFVSEDFKKTISGMPGFKNVDYRGYVDKAEVAEIYKESDIGVCTILNMGQNSEIDTLATKVYEYMSMGLPVIISDNAYTREVLQHYRFGIPVDPQNIDAISDAIIYLLDHPDECENMKTAGRKAIVERYNWNFEKEKLKLLYEKLNCS